jgi:hypothetical protein
MNDFQRAAELGGELQSLLRDVRFPLAAPIEREIQRNVCDYADELKGLGLPPERVIIAVKYTANQAGINATSAHLTHPRQLDGTDKLLADMVGWCIERYYGAPPRAD